MRFENSTINMKPTKAGVFNLQVELRNEDGIFSRSEFKIKITIGDSDKINS